MFSVSLTMASVLVAHVAASSGGETSSRDGRMTYAQRREPGVGPPNRLPVWWQMRLPSFNSGQQCRVWLYGAECGF